MGLFSSSKPDKLSSTDKVWKTKEWAIKGMVTEALRSITQNEIPIIISFFQDVQQRVLDFFNSNQVPFFVLETGLWQDALTRQKTVFILNAEFIGSSEWTGFITTLLKSSKPRFLFAGHYPLTAFENKIMTKLTAGQSVQVPVSFCLSLEDPLLRAFGSDRLKPLLETLGLKDDECIEHTMVSKSIARIQEKLEKIIKSEIQASSEEEWFKKNYKSEDE